MTATSGRDTGTFSPTGSMTETLSGHIATLLKDGRVLMVGGDLTAELYDPRVGKSVAGCPTFRSSAEPAGAIA